MAAKKITQMNAYNNLTSVTLSDHPMHVYPMYPMCAVAMLFSDKSDQVFWKWLLLEVQLFKRTKKILVQ